MISAMALEPKSITVRVPASTSNLGSGFDTLGLALRLYNYIRVTAIVGKGVAIVSPTAEEERAGATAMVSEAAKLFFRRSRKPSFGIEVAVHGDVPVARGLGYSATVRLGVIAALNELTRTGWYRQMLLEIVTILEGHPDNASPAIFGGFTVSGMLGKSVRCARFSVSSKVKFVTAIPNFKVSTESARKLVPRMFSKEDTVHSLNRAALITAAFASGDLEGLRGLFDDRLHQPYREELVPQLSRVIRAGETAGAIGGFLSGSGSAIICLTSGNGIAVAKAMRKQLPNSELRIFTADNAGFELAAREHRGTDSDTIKPVA